ncbi:hypothetical protein CROQUDRAFT_92894 [Cronartium quercuum f. sp. fusiforme G11]|uniref:Uncharacterized protein n=1 Tax=Cronartium quercuum f. sp. fusiforme G11 TaxID=708437 RepID=A0A9P6TC41_9BASI|nr:hypothetical protein CROQUDRAFT_92894 [Cronartium quercuum f. sp. fusiforme G11]
MSNKSNSAQIATDLPSPDPNVPSTSNPGPSYYDEAFITTTPSSDRSRIVTLDTGAIANMFGNRSLLSDVESIQPSPINVASKDGKVFARHQGTVILGGLRIIKVLHASEQAVNLILVGLLYDAGYKINWTKTTANILSPTGEFLIHFYRNPNTRLWQVYVKSSVSNSNSKVKQNPCTQVI